MTGFRLAVAQAPGGLEGPEARRDWLAARLAAAPGTDLMLLPELFACGYHIGPRVTACAEPADGPTAAAMARLARRHGIALCYGFAERAEGAVFNAALTLGPDGAVLHHQRKLAIPPGWERDHFTPGSGCRPFLWRGLSIAVLICYDAEFPETVRHAAGLGAGLVLVPTALGAQWGWVAGQMIPTRGFENGVFLAYANHAGTENGLTYLGASLIAAPDGEELARAGAGPEILTATLDPARVAAAQARLPYLTDRAGLQL